MIIMASTVHVSPRPAKNPVSVAINAIGNTAGQSERKNAVSSEASFGA